MFCEQQRFHKVTGIECSWVVVSYSQLNWNLHKYFLMRRRTIICYAERLGWISAILYSAAAVKEVLRVRRGKTIATSSCHCLWEYVSAVQPFLTPEKKSYKLVERWFHGFTGCFGAQVFDWFYGNAATHKGAAKTIPAYKTIQAYKCMHMC